MRKQVEKKSFKKLIFFENFAEEKNNKKLKKGWGKKLRTKVKIVLKKTF